MRRIYVILTQPVDWLSCELIRRDEILKALRMMNKGNTLALLELHQKWS